MMNCLREIFLVCLLIGSMLSTTACGTMALSPVAGSEESMVSPSPAAVLPTDPSNAATPPADPNEAVPSMPGTVTGRSYDP